MAEQQAVLRVEGAIPHNKISEFHSAAAESF
jgi:hypothetical protein